jgi:hypothetical protein
MVHERFLLILCSLFFGWRESELDKLYALLGRDVLNRFLTTLQGPHLSFEITAPDL